MGVLCSEGISTPTTPIYPIIRMEAYVGSGSAAESQDGHCHLAQGNSLELERAASDYYLCQTDSSYMQTEEDPLLPDLPLHTLISWTRWWHLTAKAFVLVFQEENLGSSWTVLEKGDSENW